MKISVITVCYNSAATLGDTVSSFLAQDHADKELLIIDGGSNDATLAIARSFAAAEIRIVSEPDLGPYDAMNKGLRLFGGDAVGMLNSDDVYASPHALTAIARGLEAADIVYGDLRMVTDHSTKTPVRMWRAGKYRRFAYQTGWMAPHPTFYARREIVARTGSFDLGYRIASDYDYMLRAMSLPGARVRYIPETLVDFQVGGISTRDWRATMQINLECLRSRRAHLRAPPLDLAFVLRPLRRLLQLRRLTGRTTPWRGSR
jgi:glycosyltransferase